MKKISILVILSLVVLLSGCSANYEVEIVNDKIKEKTSMIDMDSYKWDKELPINTNGVDIVSDKAMTFREYVDKSFANSFPALSNDANTFYEKKKVDNKKELGIVYNYIYDFSNYKYSNIINSCYRYFNVLDSNDLYILSTNDTINCLSYDNVDSITIHLKTNHKVKSNNASRVDGYNYYWTFTEANKDNAGIYIELYKDKYVFNYENKITIVLTIFISLAILAFIVIIIFRKKASKNNRI